MEVGVSVYVCTRWVCPPTFANAEYNGKKNLVIKSVNNKYKEHKYQYLGNYECKLVLFYLFWDLEDNSDLLVYVLVG